MSDFFKINPFVICVTPCDSSGSFGGLLFTVIELLVQPEVALAKRCCKNHVT